MTEDLKKRQLFADLGKATRRGIRKCPQCGTINGTRGMSCKNSLCDMVFKESLDKPRRVNLDACKIITEESSCMSWTTIFSVRVKERCSEFRGFVQIEHEDLSSSDETNGGHAETNPILLQLESVESVPIKGTCYVLGCARKNQTRKITNSGLDLCVHILACVFRPDVSESEPITLKQSVLNSMSISADCKQRIFMKSQDAPLVQRVSPTTMVVKCDKNEFLHPLGYLHTTFLKSSSHDPTGSFKFGCQCSLSIPTTTAKKKSGSIVTANMPELHSSSTPILKVRCIHFYSCVAAFSSSVVLAKEFSRFISDEQVVSSMQQVIAILGDDNADVKVEVMGEENLDLFPIPATRDELEQSFRIEMESEETGHTITLSEGINTDDLLGTAAVNPSKPKTETKVYECTNDLISQQPTPKPNISYGFQEWLSSVTERINLTMHYGCSGTPDPLTWLVPQSFFNALMERISPGPQKKRLPNTTQTIERPPQGQFIKYTWLITNIFQLKKIFDTPLVALEISRKFTLDANGTYRYKTPVKEDPSLLAKRQKLSKCSKPEEYKTFLKVGQMSTNPGDITPFKIEWVQDMLPRSKTGEMTIKLEFGHQINGQIDTTIPKKSV